MDLKAEFKIASEILSIPSEEIISFKVVPYLEDPKSYQRQSVLWGEHEKEDFATNKLKIFERIESNDAGAKYSMDDGIPFFISKAPSTGVEFYMKDPSDIENINPYYSNVGWYWNGGPSFGSSLEINDINEDLEIYFPED